jgi:hypothetical protein
MLCPILLQAAIKSTACDQSRNRRGERSRRAAPEKAIDVLKML